MRSARALLFSAIVCVSSSAHADAVAPISAALCAEMKARGVMSAHPPIGCGRLALVRFTYLGFDGREHGDGEVVVLDVLAGKVASIFADLRAHRFPIQQARLMNTYGGDDDASMDANNTSAYNDRNVFGTNSLSMHAYGAAIDINPVQNPYLQRDNGVLTVAPKAGEPYVKRAPLRPGMAEAAVRVFAAHGFIVWGGRWRNPDYQHFQIERTVAEKLLRLPPDQARAILGAAR